MKKIYVVPALEIYNVIVQRILAGSTSSLGYGGTGNNEKPVLSRQNNSDLWDEEEW